MTSLSRSRITGGLVALVVLVVVVTALFILGSPVDERILRLDERRVTDLDQLARAIDLYWTRHGNLPASLTEVQQEQGGRFGLNDPATNSPYGYQAVDGRAFEVCAEFEAESEEKAPAIENGFWSHRAGRQCFRRDARKVD